MKLKLLASLALLMSLATSVLAKEIDLSGLDKFVGKYLPITCRKPYGMIHDYTDSEEIEYLEKWEVSVREIVIDKKNGSLTMQRISQAPCFYCNPSSDSKVYLPVTILKFTSIGKMQHQSSYVAGLIDFSIAKTKIKENKIVEHSASLSGIFPVSVLKNIKTRSLELEDNMLVYKNGLFEECVFEKLQD